jgi:predicted enzyme related to lactoylglutathione lyase
MASAISWFQIPATDIARAKRFYETVCGIQFEQLLASPGMEMWGFPADWEQGEVSGALVCGEGAVPSATGTAVFLNADPDLQVMLGRVEPAGGRILVPRTAVGMEGAGHFAMITDTEGNTVGLYSRG